MAHSRNTVPQPKDRTMNRNGAKITVRFRSGFGKEMTGNVQQWQKVLDSEVMRLMEPYMPLVTGSMIRSMQNTTVIGSGRVDVNTPYALRVLNGKSAVGRPTGPLRGPRYFERMKADKLPQLKRTMENVTGGKIK